MLRRVMVPALLLLFGCTERQPEARDGAEAAPYPAQSTGPLDLAREIAAARVAAVTGDAEGVDRHSREAARQVMRSARIPDSTRPIDPEAARAAIRPMAGVRSAVWIDRANLLVMVDSAALRSDRTIDSVCRALEPLGDTLAVVVNLQNLSATGLEESATLSRNCQLPTGERAWLQGKRRIDVVPREELDAFTAQQRNGRR